MDKTKSQLKANRSKYFFENIADYRWFKSVCSVTAQKASEHEELKRNAKQPIFQALPSEINYSCIYISLKSSDR